MTKDFKHMCNSYQAKSAQRTEVDVALQNLVRASDIENIANILVYVNVLLADASTMHLEFNFY